MIHQKGGKCESNICGLYIFLYYFNTHIHSWWIKKQFTKAHTFKNISIKTQFPIFYY